MYHIGCLLINLFYLFFPDLIKAGMIYIINCPLYGVVINKKFIPLYTKEDCSKYSDKYNILRFKGLGRYNVLWSGIHFAKNKLS